MTTLYSVALSLVWIPRQPLVFQKFIIKIRTYIRTYIKRRLSVSPLHLLLLPLPSVPHSIYQWAVGQPTSASGALQFKWWHFACVHPPKECSLLECQGWWTNLCLLVCFYFIFVLFIFMMGIFYLFLQIYAHHLCKAASFLSFFSPYFWCLLHRFAKENCGLPQTRPVPC